MEYPRVHGDYSDLSSDACWHGGIPLRTQGLLIFGRPHARVPRNTPRIRGSHRYVDEAEAEAGIGHTPAYTGFSPSICRLLHACGHTPAYTGLLSSSRPCTVIWTVYPRTHGDSWDRYRIGMELWGIPPCSQGLLQRSVGLELLTRNADRLVRGLWDLRCIAKTNIRHTPACAGTACLRKPLALIAKEYPRIRGDNIGVLRYPGVGSGIPRIRGDNRLRLRQFFSLRGIPLYTRGQLEFPVDTSSWRRNTPMRVGTAPCGPCSDSSGMEYPRVYGDNRDGRQVIVVCPGIPPRV